MNKEELEYEHYCNEQLRNKITNLEYKIKRLEEDNKYKKVLDKIKEYLNKNANAPVYLDMKLYETEVYNYIIELLEEIE